MGQRLATAAENNVISAITGTGLVVVIDDVGGTPAIAGMDPGNIPVSAEQIQDASAALIQAGTGISWVYDDENATLTPTITLSPFSTTNLSEGTNLYHTSARVDARISAALGISVQAHGAVLDDLNTLGAPLSDGEIIVSTGPGMFAYESGAVARASLGLSIGSNVQAWSANLDSVSADPLTATTASTTYQPLDADLTTIAGLASTDGNFIVGSATGWVVESAATVRASLGVVIGTNVQAWSTNLDGLAADPLTATTAAATYETIVNVTAHTSNTFNPHAVTKAQVGLGSVEDTPLSTWTGSANITAIGTLASGTVPWARLSDVSTASPTFAGLTAGDVSYAGGSVNLDASDSSTWVVVIAGFGGGRSAFVSARMAGGVATVMIAHDGTTGLSSDISISDGIEMEFRINGEDLEVRAVSSGSESASVTVSALKMS